MFDISDHHYCKRCGKQYDFHSIEPPEDASYYWVPSCPVCNAKCTANTVDETWLEIVGSHLDVTEDDYEEHRDRLHIQARLCHGKTVGLSKEELIERALWFDSKVLNHNRESDSARRYGPSPSRDVAFQLRKQARNI